MDDPLLSHFPEVGAMVGIMAALLALMILLGSRSPGGRRGRAPSWTKALAELATRHALPIAETASWTEHGLPVEVRLREDGLAEIRVRGLPENVLVFGAERPRRVAPERVTTGDPEIDVELFVAGDPDVVRGTLGPSSRKALLELIRDVPDAELTPDGLEVRGSPGELARLLPKLETRLPAVGRLLRDEQASVETRAKGDPLPGVRRVCVASLSDRREAARATLEAALSDPDPGVRLEAALVLGEPSVESVLAGLLRQLEGADRIAAVEALGDLGTAASVEALRSVPRATRADLARAVDEAVARIQARAAGTGGELSLAAHDRGGALSVAGHAGALSVVKREDPER